MANIDLQPYLFFEGNCREAMEFYKEIFGGELTIQTFSEVPGDYPDDQKNQVMHASLAGDVALMASDGDPEKKGSGKVSLSLGGEDETVLRQFFDGLGQGGKIVSPLKQELWGDTFGMLTDKFGIDWMVNIEAKKEG
jgi:PhnB protein